MSTTLPLFAAILPLEPEPEKISFALAFDYASTPREGDLPLVNVLPRVLINGKQVGLISSLEIKLNANEAFPQVIVRIGEDLTKEMASQCSVDLKTAARKYIDELRRFPFIQVESPFIEETNSAGISTI